MDNCIKSRMGSCEQVNSCGICGGQTKIYLKDVFDDRYGYPGMFALSRCCSCDAIETLPRLSESELPSLYTTYYPRRNLDISVIAPPQVSPNTWRQRMLRWLNGTNNQGQYCAKPGMKVLDYGCGAGQSLLDLRELGAEGYGVEADRNVARIAQHHGINIYIGSIFDNPFPNVKFDLIILNQVLEHVPDPVRLLQVLSERLQDGGRLVLAVPNADSLYRRLFGRLWINWHIPYHLHHFNKRSLRTLAARKNWRLVGIRTITPNLWTVLQIRAVFSTTTLGVPNPMWTPALGGEEASNPSFVKRIARKLLSTGIRLVAPVIGMANRTVDALGWGDSLFVELEYNGKLD